MGKKIYAELDRITFDSIKISRSANGMIDENKFFRGLKEGDSVIFSCNKRKIEAVLKKVKKYNSISEYLKMNPHIGMMEVNYYPYGDDGAGGGWGSNRLNNSGNPGNRELEDFISALFGGDIDDE